MTYDEFIQDIINTRGQWNIEEGAYYEAHHIIPKCLGGTPKSGCVHRSKDINIIWLYPQEHYEAHRLLVEKYPNNSKLLFAWILLAFPNHNKGRIFINAEEYALLKKLAAKQASIDSSKRKPMLGKHLTEEQKQKISARHKGKHFKQKNSNRRGKHYYTNGIDNKMFFEDEVPDDTWHQVIHEKKVKPQKPKKDPADYKIHQKKTDAEKLQRSVTMKNKHLHWYNNGVDEIRCTEDKCPDGWVSGRSQKMIDHLSEKRLANPVRNIGEKNGFFGKHHTPEQKAKASAISRSHRWYNNGVEETCCTNCPEGFHPGRLPR